MEWVRAPGSCGELVQGAPAGRWLQVPCPVDRWARAHFTPDRENPAFRTPAVDADKALRAIRVVLRGVQDRAPSRDAPEHLPIRGGRLDLHSPLPRGKGMGSSTADVTAAAGAALNALGHPLEPNLLARVALSVEPSDGTMFPDLTLFDHREGRIREELGPPPPLRIVAVEPPEEVDTEAFNRRVSGSDRAGPELVSGWNRAFREARRAIRTGDPQQLGHAATASSRLHQALLPSPLLTPLLRVVRLSGAVGLNRAHSGTVFGLLFAPGFGRPGLVSELLAREELDFLRIHDLKLIPGGLRRDEWAAGTMSYADAPAPLAGPVPDQ